MKGEKKSNKYDFSGGARPILMEKIYGVDTITMSRNKKFQIKEIIKKIIWIFQKFFCKSYLWTARTTVLQKHLHSLLFNIYVSQSDRSGAPKFKKNLIFILLNGNRTWKNIKIYCSIY